MLLPGPSLSPLGSGRRLASSHAPAAGYALWLKADAGVLNGSGSAATDGDAVATWQDQSGNGNDAAQATGANRPTFKASIVNGEPVLRFAGSAWLDLTTALGGDPSTVLAVFRPSAGGGAYTIVSGNGGSLQYAIETAGTNQRLVKSFTADIGLGSATLSTTAFSLGGYRYSTSASDADLRLNGAADGSLSPLTLGAQTMMVGANPPAGPGEAFSGDLAEILFYPSALSDADRAATEAYLNSKYSIY